MVVNIFDKIVGCRLFDGLIFGGTIFEVEWSVKNNLNWTFLYFRVLISITVFIQ